MELLSVIALSTIFAGISLGPLMMQFSLVFESNARVAEVNRLMEAALLVSRTITQSRAFASSFAFTGDENLTWTDETGQVHTILEQVTGSITTDASNDQTVVIRLEGKGIPGGATVRMLACPLR
ncbi:hypothetical protein KBA41_14325 [Candidatus Ozemobacteraceae bacterium]|nr:hypothetical protein [Candidatus Ozemobacteraceae bacterium]